MTDTSEFFWITSTPCIIFVNCALGLHPTCLELLLYMFGNIIERLSFFGSFVATEALDRSRFVVDMTRN